MKKIIPSFICLFIIFSSLHGQSFELHPTGFKDSTNVNKEYIVFNFATKKQKDLYTDFLVEINSMYTSLGDIIHVVENQSVTVSSFSNNSLIFQKLYKYDLKCNLKYTLTFLFKDGKVRINAPVLNEISGEIANVDLGSLGKLDSRSKIHLIGDNSIWAIGEKSIFNKDGELKEKDIKKDLELFFNGLVSSVVKSVKKYEIEVW